MAKGDEGVGVGGAEYPQADVLSSDIQPAQRGSYPRPDKVDQTVVLQLMTAVARIVKLDRPGQHQFVEWLESDRVVHDARLSG